MNRPSGGDVPITLNGCPSPSIPALVLWPAGMNRPWQELLEIASSARMDAISLSPPILDTIEAQGLTPLGLAERLAEAGLVLSHLDGVSSWATNPHPDPDDDGYALTHALFDYPIGRLLDMADTFGMKAVAAVGAFSKGTTGFDEICRSFADFCDRAKTHDIRVDLEFIPHWGIPDLPAAWKIVSAVNRDNCGILVDTWHLQKGSRDFEADMALLETIPGHILSTVQLCDDQVAMREDTTFQELIRHGRSFPGEGELAIVRILATIARKGGLTSIGPEPFSADLATLPVADIARRADQSTRHALVAAMACAERSVVG